MRKSLGLVAACVGSLFVADAAVAQPRPYGEAERQRAQPSPPPPPQGGQPYGLRRPGGQGPGVQNYYYNGRWVGPDEWRRRSSERDRWARNYERRHGRRDQNDSSALLAGIIGFALGAAIVGSQQQAEQARTADQSWDSYCARKYRSYDRRSRTYLGSDGLRHFCQ